MSDLPDELAHGPITTDVAARVVRRLTRQSFSLIAATALR
jgi:hypothetical protein